MKEELSKQLLRGSTTTNGTGLLRPWLLHLLHSPACSLVFSISKSSSWGQCRVSAGHLPFSSPPSGTRPSALLESSAAKQPLGSIPFSSPQIQKVALTHSSSRGICPQGPARVFVACLSCPRSPNKLILPQASSFSRAAHMPDWAIFLWASPLTGTEKKSSGRSHTPSTRDKPTPWVRLLEECRGVPAAAPPQAHSQSSPTGCCWPPLELGFPYREHKQSLPP